MTATTALLLDVTLKASLLCLLAFVGVRLARSASAALRHDIGLSALICSALLPFLSALPQLTGPLSDLAPVHRTANAVAAALPPDAPGAGVALIDRIWSGDGGSVLPPWLAAALGAAWLAGVAVALLRSFRDYRAAVAIVRRAKPYAATSGRPGVPVLATAELNAPALFGWRAPVILLPSEASGWPCSRLDAVIAHELAHVDRRDYLGEWLLELACAINWYNPLVLRLAAFVRAEREIACDDRALAGGLDRRDYAEALVRIARGARQGVRGPLLAMAAPPELERRVRKILSSYRHPVLAAWHRVGIAAIALALFVPAAALTAPASGLLGAGSVQPGAGPLSGLDDPRSERVPLPYDQLALAAASVPAAGPGAKAIAALKAHLDHKPRSYDDLVRERVIWTLAQVRNGQLFEPLVERVTDPDWRVRGYAAWGLGMAGDRRATPRLARMLDDPVWRVRAMAAAALASLADSRAADAVVEALADPAWQVRLSAIDYFDRIGDRAHAAHLRPLLDDPHTATRLRAQEVLERF